MEHIGSTSVEGMCAKPVIDILLIQGNIRDNFGATTYHDTIDTLISMGYTDKYGRKNIFAYDNTLLIKVV